MYRVSNLPILVDLHLEIWISSLIQIRLCRIGESGSRRTAVWHRHMRECGSALGNVTTVRRTTTSHVGPFLEADIRSGCPRGAYALGYQLDEDRPWLGTVPEPGLQTTTTH